MFSNNLSTGAIIGNTFVLTLAPSMISMGWILLRSFLRDRNLSNNLPLRKLVENDRLERGASSATFLPSFVTAQLSTRNVVREQSSSRNPVDWYIRRIETAGPGNEVIRQEWGTESRGPRLLTYHRYERSYCVSLFPSPPPESRVSGRPLYLEHA